MPAKSKSQQRLFGMVHAYNKGEFRGSRALRSRIAALSRHISDADAKDFAETPHDGLPEKKKEKRASSPQYPAFFSRAVLGGAEPRVVWKPHEMLQVIGPKGNADPSDVMIVSEKEALQLLLKGLKARRAKEPPALSVARRPAEKRAQAMVRPEVLQEMYGRVPVGAYAGDFTRSVRSEQRRSFLGHVLYGTGAGAIVGGLGAAGLGAFIVSHAAQGSKVPQADVRRRMLEAAAKCGLWGAGRGAAVGTALGAGLGVMDKIRG